MSFFLNFVDSTTLLILFLTKLVTILHILSLEEVSPSYKRFDTLNKDGQSLHRLSNSTLSTTIKMLHPSDLITHVINENAYNILS
jgi:hypothetical protein